MIKKIFAYCLTVAISLTAMSQLIGSAADADGTITIEGEKVSSFGFRGDKIFENSFSENYAYGISTKPNKDTEYYLTYNFYVAAAGEYTFTGITTALTNVGSGYQWTTDYTITLNGEYIFDKTNTSDNGAVSTSYYSNLIRNYSYGTVYLNKGQNKIRIDINKYDKNTNNGNLEFLIDVLKFTPTGSTTSVLNEIKPTADLGIFNQSSNVRIKYVFSIPTTESKDYIFNIQDVWGKKIKIDTITVPKGVREYNLNLGSMPCGWYSIKTYTSLNDINIKHTYICVIKPQSLSENDNVFAMDFASSQLVTRDYDAAKYIQALKKAGINWVRERYEISSDYDSRASRLNMLKNENLNVLDMNGMPGSDIMGDLFTVRDNYARAAEFLSDYAKVMEVGNEPDISSAMLSTPDSYAAFYKAAAIGIAETNPQMLKSMAGIAGQDFHVTEKGARYIGYDGKSYYVNNTTNYTDILLQNDILTYSDVFNYHYHQGATTNDVVDFFGFPLTEANIMTYAYNNEKPVWVTEAGETTRSYTSGEYAPFEDYVNQARYLVTSYVQSVAKGTDKHFWFVFPYYPENNGEFGVFTKYMTPYPAYAALANTTDLLKNTEYKGRLNCPTPGVEGHVFTDGSKDIAVVWSTSPTKLQLTSCDALVRDFMGYTVNKISCEKTKYCTGKISVNISHFPVFIELPEKISDDEYYPVSSSVDYPTPVVFTDSQKLVLQPEWQGDTSITVARSKGYTLEMGESENLKMTLYNMSDSDFSGILTADISDTLTIDKNDIPFTVKSGETSEFVFSVSCNEGAKDKETDYIKISGQLDNGDTISPYVAKIYIKDSSHTEDNIQLFEGFADNSNWDFSNKQVGITDHAAMNAADNSVTFNVSGGGWYYPDFYPTASDIAKLKEATGICFWLDHSETATNCGNNVFAITTDGRKYYIGDSNRIYFEKGSRQINIKWSDFVLSFSPLGNVDFRVLDPSDIKCFQLGGNFAKYCPEYTIKDFALFYSEDGTNGLNNCISIDGVYDFKTYEQGSKVTLNAYLPEDEYSDIFVLNREERLEDFSVNDNVVSVDLSQFSRGFYSLIVCAKNKFDYVNRAVVNFYIK